jgi:HSP20 family protein
VARGTRHVVRFTVPWDPLRDLRSWQERLERLSTPQSDSWTPAVDVYETAEHYVIAAEVPGLARDQIDIALEEFRLTLRGQRPGDNRGTPVTRYHQVERGHGSFVRTFEFAAKIDVEAVTADLTHGVLTVRLAKAPLPPARKIEVR